MARIEWQNGTLSQPATVEVGGQSYEVSEAVYSGTTPLSAENLNAMQNDIYGEIDDIKEVIEEGNSYSKLTLTAKTTNLSTNSWQDMATAQSLNLKAGSYIVVCNFSMTGTTSSNGIASARITLNGAEKIGGRETIYLYGSSLISSGSITSFYTATADETVSFNCQSYANVTTKVSYNPTITIIKLI